VADFRLDVKRGVLRFLREYSDSQAAREMIQEILSVPSQPQPPQAAPVAEVPGLYVLHVRGGFLYSLSEEKGVITVNAYQVQAT
jgi:hypothetical protein